MPRGCKRLFTYSRSEGYIQHAVFPMQRVVHAFAAWCDGITGVTIEKGMIILPVSMDVAC